MPEEVLDAKQETVGSFDAQADKFFAEKEEVLAESSAAETKGAEGTETQGETGADLSKKAISKEKEETSGAGKAIEEKLAKIAEIMGDDKDVIDAYIKSKGYHKDPAWQKILAKAKTAGEQPVLDEETQKKLAQVNKVLSDPNFIRFQMKAEGYKDEAIDERLRSLGHKVEGGDDALNIVIKKLGIDVDKLTPEGKQYVDTYIADVAKVADILLSERLSKILPETLKPLNENVASIVQRDAGMKMMDDMEEIVTSEDILDFDKDILPELEKVIEENKDNLKFQQPQIFEAFKEINHRLSVERLKTGKRKESREEAKGNLRSQKESGVKPDLSQIPKGKNFDESADNWFAAHPGVY